MNLHKNNTKHYWLYHNFLFNWLEELTGVFSNWLWKKSKNEAEEKARETFKQKMKDLTSLHMQSDIEELYDQDEQKDARAS